MSDRKVPIKKAPKVLSKLGRAAASGKGALGSGPGRDILAIRRTLESRGKGKEDKREIGQSLAAHCYTHGKRYHHQRNVKARGRPW